MSPAFDIRCWQYQKIGTEPDRISIRRFIITVKSSIYPTDVRLGCSKRTFEFSLKFT